MNDSDRDPKTHKETTLRSQMGITAQVEREDYENEDAINANDALREVGNSLHPVKQHMEHVKYVGSGAIHVYQAESTRQVFYQTQLIGNIPSALAPLVTKEFTGKFMEHFRGKRQKWRSGL